MNKKLHILFLCSWYPSRVLPTNGDFIERHAKAIGQLHKVSVLHIISDTNSTKSTFETQTLENVTSYIGYVKQTSNPVLKTIRFYKMYQLLLKQIEVFDLVHLHVLHPFGIFALHQKFLKKKAYLISEHWTGYLKSQKNKVSIIQKLTTKYAHFVCPVSKELMTDMQSLGLNGNYKVLENVVDTKVFKPALKKTTKFTIVHVSNLNDAQKNITGMLQAAKKLENHIGSFTWRFIGGLSNEYDSLIKELQFKKATIQFINHVSQQELASHLQKATVCVSFSNYETFGITMTEAIACGTFVVSTSTGILNELPRKEYFSIIPQNDENALVDQLIQLKDNNTRFSATTMHSFIEDQFSQKIIAEKFSNLYFQSLNTSS